jgi:cation transport ATPase
LALAFAALVIWVFHGGTFEMALSASLAALIAADPFLFIDLRAMLSVGIDRRLERRNIHLRYRSVLRDLGHCDVIYIQKSEVLTRGVPTVQSVISFDDGYDETRVLRLAAAAQYGVRHPLRTAILNHPNVAGGTIPRVKGYEHLSARGVRALLQDAIFSAGT